MITELKILGELSFLISCINSVYFLFFCYFSTGWLNIFLSFFLKVFSCEEMGKNSQWCRLKVDLNNSSVWPCSCSSLCDNERDPLGPRYLPVSDSHNTRQTDNLHTEAGLWLFLHFYIFCTLLNIYRRQLLEIISCAHCRLSLLPVAFGKRLHL